MARWITKQKIHNMKKINEISLCWRTGFLLRWFLILDDTGNWREKVIYPRLPWYAFAIYREDELLARKKSLCIKDCFLLWSGWYSKANSYWAFTSPITLFTLQQTCLHSWAWCHDTLDLETSQSSCLLKWCWCSSTSKSLVKEKIVLNEI